MRWPTRLFVLLVVCSFAPGTLVHAQSDQPANAANDRAKPASQAATKDEVEQLRREVADLMLQAWWCLVENKPFGESMPAEKERQDGWRSATAGRVVELGWLARKSARQARYEPLEFAQIGL